MNRRLLFSFSKVVIFFLGMSMAVSCTQTKRTSTRKKMPELADDGDGFEGAVWAAGFSQAGGFSGVAGFSGAAAGAFAATEVDLVVDGRRQGFVSVAMPDGRNDSAAIRLLETMRPFASSLLSGWAQQDRNGLIIDLAGHHGLTVLSAEFRLEKAGAFSIPLVIRYDQGSAERLGIVKTLLGELPADIIVKTIE